MRILPQVFAILLAASGGLRAVSPEDLRPPDDLMYVFERPPMYGSKDEFTAFFSEQRKKILEAKDITDRLYDLLWPAVEAGREDLYQPIFRALRIRGDLAPDQLDKIAERVRETATPAVANTSTTERYFVESAASMLGSYPSPKHEELLLSLLTMGDECWSRAAAGSLAESGSKRSIEPLRRWMAERAAQGDPKIRDELSAGMGKTTWNDRMAKAIEKLEKRVAAVERQSSQRHRQVPTPQEANSNPPKSSFPQEQAKSIAVLFAGVLFVLAFVYYLLGRRGRA